MTMFSVGHRRGCLGFGFTLTLFRRGGVEVDRNVGMGVRNVNSRRGMSDPKVLHDRL